MVGVWVKVSGAGAMWRAEMNNMIILVSIVFVLMYFVVEESCLFGISAMGRSTMVYEW